MGMPRVRPSLYPSWWEWPLLRLLTQSAREERDCAWSAGRLAELRLRIPNECDDPRVLIAEGEGLLPADRKTLQRAVATAAAARAETERERRRADLAAVAARWMEAEQALCALSQEARGWVRADEELPLPQKPYHLQYIEQVLADLQRRFLGLEEVWGRAHGILEDSQTWRDWPTADGPTEEVVAHRIARIRTDMPKEVARIRECHQRCGMQVHDVEGLTGTLRELIAAIDQGDGPALRRLVPMWERMGNLRLLLRSERLFHGVSPVAFPPGESWENADRTKQLAPAAYVDRLECVVRDGLRSSSRKEHPSSNDEVRAVYFAPLPEDAYQRVGVMLDPGSIALPVFHGPSWPDPECVVYARVLRAPFRIFVADFDSGRGELSAAYLEAVRTELRHRGIDFVSDPAPTWHRSHGGRLRLERGAIERLNVDAIVCAADETLRPGDDRSVSGAIFRAAGADFRRECAALGPVPAGAVVGTGAGHLKARRVLHAVGPRWNGGENGEDEVLAQCYRESLRVAVAAGLRSIAFPALSRGHKVFPPERAARIALDVVSTFLSTDVTLQSVTLVCSNREDLALYTRLTSTLPR